MKTLLITLSLIGLSKFSLLSKYPTAEPKGMNSNVYILKAKDNILRVKFTNERVSNVDTIYFIERGKK